MLTVAGAGMAGLAAAARAAELGVRTVALERAPRPGGSLALSSGVVWRHRTLDDFRAECPGGDPELQRLVVERLDEAIAWLRRLGAPVAAAGTGNPLTVGVRFDPAGLVEALAARARPQPGRSPAGDELPLLLATGGAGARLARERGLPLRAAPWSDGAGIAVGRARGGALAGDPAEFYGRLLPATAAPIEPRDWARAAQLYGRHGLAVDAAGRPVLPAPPRWHETDLAQAVAALPGGRAWLVVDGDALGEAAGGGRTVADAIAVAAELGAAVRRASTLAALGLGPLDAERLRTPPFTAVPVRAAITHTYAGLRVDAAARVLDDRGRPVPGLYAAGADAGGIFTGGYASGLAAALVLGLAAAESVAAV